MTQAKSKQQATSKQLARFKPVPKAKKASRKKPEPEPEPKTKSEMEAKMAELADRLGCYWLEKGSKYIVRENGNFNVLGVEDFRLRLAALKLSPQPRGADRLSEMDAFRIYVQMTRKIVAVSPISGYNPGLHTLGGGRVLVPTGPHMIRPQKGDWSYVRDLLCAVLGDDIQFHLFCGYLRNRHLTIVNAGSTAFTGLVLFLVGPRACGKSRLQEDVITHVLGGGGMGKFFEYASGADKFTDDISVTAHWGADDVTEKAATHSDRVKLAKKFKELAHTNTARWRPFCGSPFQSENRVGISVSLNSESDEVQMLPELILQDGLRDKFLMLSCRRNDFPWPDTGDEAALADYRAKIADAMPAFIDYLLREYQVPRGFEDRRSLVRGWIAPEIRDVLIREDVYELIDTLRRHDYWKHENEWTGTATRLYHSFDLGEEWTDKSKRFGKLGGAMACISTMYPGHIEKVKRTARSRGGWRICKLPDPDTP